MGTDSKGEEDQFYNNNRTSIGTGRRANVR